MLSMVTDLEKHTKKYQQIYFFYCKSNYYALILRNKYILPKRDSKTLIKVRV